ncbi:protein PTST, chloroplastic isoform X2 [Phoenix dactylifera]|uniref:Protein PTST, chloroplastic isoform X2 n=2 Tax=Phoenix dactylifera TaxID=42345 RepID=A0A8B7MX19_PHODC|nr:protein PTST, chloroplastic isoform X2 [Phoenix dactylifera]
MMHQESCAQILAADDVRPADGAQPVRQLRACPEIRESARRRKGVGRPTGYHKRARWPLSTSKSACGYSVVHISTPPPYQEGTSQCWGSPDFIHFKPTPPFSSSKLKRGYSMACLKTSVIRKLDSGHCSVIPSYVSSDGLWPQRLAYKHCASVSSAQQCKFISVIYPTHPLFRRHSSWRVLAAPISLDEEPSSLSEGENFDGTSEIVSKDASEMLLPQKLKSDELKSLLSDAERQKLTRKLSEANQYNRFLKRQSQIKEDALVKFKSELAVLELELQALVGLAEEVANSGVQLGSRKINGKYIQSHLLSRLEAVHEKVKEQIKDVDLLKFEEITLFWIGMAESVQVMGSFDGWTQGEEMSPEYSGDYARFSTTLKLRPGRYEIKFLVNGEWQLSPELPTVGEGMMQNNLLVVE